jgi:hypothetical protein
MSSKPLKLGHGVFISTLATERRIHKNTVRKALKRYSIAMKLMDGPKFPYRPQQALTIKDAATFALKWDEEHSK